MCWSAVMRFFCSFQTYEFSSNFACVVNISIIISFWFWIFMIFSSHWNKEQNKIQKFYYYMFILHARWTHIKHIHIEPALGLYILHTQSNDMALTVSKAKKKNILSRRNRMLRNLWEFRWHYQTFFFMLVPVKKFVIFLKVNWNTHIVCGCDLVIGGWKIFFVVIPWRLKCCTNWTSNYRNEIRWQLFWRRIVYGFCAKRKRKHLFRNSKLLININFFVCYFYSYTNSHTHTHSLFHARSFVFGRLMCVQCIHCEYSVCIL